MTKEIILHYKKSINMYRIFQYDNQIDIDFYTDKIKKYYMNSKKPRNGHWTGEKVLPNVSEENFLENYGNKLVGVSSEYLTVVIEEYDNKISLKTYHTEKIRNVGCTYFKVRRFMKYCTYNLKTKNFYFGEVERKNKALIKKKIRSNKFDINFLTQFRLYIRRLVIDLVFGKQLDSNINADLISQETIGVFSGILSHKTSINIDSYANNLDAEIFKFYLQHNGFKYPDNYKEYVNIFVPKKKLRKNNNLVSLVMTEMNLGGSRIRKIFNQQQNIDFYLIAKLYNLLGIDYFNKLNDNFLNYNTTSSYIVDLKVFKTNVDISNLSSLLSNKDKRRIVNVLNEKTDLSLILDHLRMIEKLKNQYEYIFKMKFTDRDSFDQEHYQLSEILGSYKKGEITRSYGDYFKERVEEPIICVDGIDYYPVLLTTTKDYNGESYVQSNCVRTYIENPHSLIISLREGSPKSDERVTIEYQFRRNKMLRVQSLGKYNKKLTSKYDVPLEMLDSRINDLYKQDILHLPIMVKKFKTGKEIKTTAYYKDKVNDNKQNFGGELPIWDNISDFEKDFFTFDLLF